MPDPTDSIEKPTTDNASPSVERVRAALAGHGVAGAIRWLDDSARTAAAAAEQLGITPAQIANSLVFTADDEPVLVMASGGHRVDTAKVAAAFGASHVGRADPDTVRAATGFAIGGVAPVGHPTPLRTLVDHALADHDEVWAAGGHPKSVFPTTYDELLRITGGTAADVGVD
jgi:prolyl-tRNA editing enzyme YbaK/EbsC (Cys-tRNA(Pro) deacylase)